MGQADSLDIAVIGGGAAGFFGAIAAAQANPQNRVTLYEAGPEPLAKVGISGGGRCNVTHHCFEPAQLVQNYPRGGKALRGAFSRFQPKDTVAWFRQRGVKLKTEADGRMFPVTDRSETIINCLTEAAQTAGVHIKVRSPTTAIDKTARGFTLKIKDQQIKCDRVLLATGSSPRGHRIAESLGHSLASPVPSLFTLHIPDRALHQLSGVAVESVTVRLQSEQPDKKPGKQRAKQGLSQTGPLLITHWGMSGPAILKLSAWGARVLHDQGYRGTLEVNWLPAHKQDEVRSHLQHLKPSHSKKSLSSFSPWPSLSKRLWQYLLAKSDINRDLTWANLSKKQLNRLVETLTQSPFIISGKGVFKDEFVTCGGIALKEIAFKTMESKRCAGLFFAGEVIDIDGVTGGFNFQNAWTTGWIAGQAISTIII